MNGEEAAAMEGEASDEEDSTFKKMLRSKIICRQYPTPTLHITTPPPLPAENSSRNAIKSS